MSWVHGKDQKRLTAGHGWEYTQHWILVHHIGFSAALLQVVKITFGLVGIHRVDSRGLKRSLRQALKILAGWGSCDERLLPHHLSKIVVKSSHSPAYFSFSRPLSSNSKPLRRNDYRSKTILMDNRIFDQLSQLERGSRGARPRASFTHTRSFDTPSSYSRLGLDFSSIDPEVHDSFNHDPNRFNGQPVVVNSIGKLF